jgi:hypothetical protein
MECTRNNISTHHVLRGSDLKFTFQAQSLSTVSTLAIFLMASNHNILSGDMYYIKMKSDMYQYQYEYMYTTSSRREWNTFLSKCTTVHKNEHMSLPGESVQRRCNLIQTQVSISQFL